MQFHIPLCVSETLIGCSSVKPKGSKTCLSDYSWNKMQSIKQYEAYKPPWVLDDISSEITKKGTGI